MTPAAIRRAAAQYCPNRLGRQPHYRDAADVAKSFKASGGYQEALCLYGATKTFKYQVLY